MVFLTILLLLFALFGFAATVILICYFFDQARPNKKIKFIIDDFFNDQTGWERKSSERYFKNEVTISWDYGSLSMCTIEAGRTIYFDITKQDIKYFKERQKEQEGLNKTKALDKAFGYFKPKVEEKPKKVSIVDLSLSKRDAKKINNLGEF